MKNIIELSYGGKIKARVNGGKINAEQLLPYQNERCNVGQNNNGRNLMYVVVVVVL